MQHVYPLDDSGEHCLTDTTCACLPRIDWNLGLIIHHAYDGREIIGEALWLADNHAQTLDSLYPRADS